ncbi:MAG TPA: methyltransferase domain-containing protein [Gemmatimonadaceae bacterium]|nr:methyltransferase domain-containing protein [Gemmatimonadaceae bacterium]
MRTQRFKDVVFGSTRPATRLNHHAWRVRLSGGVPAKLPRAAGGSLWLNVGSGHRPLPGFVNIDINLARRPDMWLDVRNGLPFEDGTVDRIYSCHVLEHFYYDELTGVLRDFHRVLRPGGGMRLLVPSMEEAARAYLAGDASLLANFPRATRSLGGRLFNTIFCDGQHRIGFDFSFAEELLQDAGFSDIREAKKWESVLYPRELLQRVEPDESWIDTSLIVEVIR